MKPFLSRPIKALSCISMIILSFYGSRVIGQPSCITSVGAIYGTPNGNERGKCLLPTAAGDGLYAVGMKEDSVLIAKLNLMGQIIWARTFDIIPGEIDHVSTAFLDSDGMIFTEGIAGDYTDGGNIFAFRYNPNTNQVLWAKEYVNSTMRSYTSSATQTTNGDYLLGLLVIPPVPAQINDSELFQISKSTGNAIGGMDKVYNLGGSDEFYELILYQNFIYGCGRYTDGMPNSKMRSTIMKIDPSNLSQVWIKCGHVNQAATARLYNRDMIIDADMLYSISFGDPTGTTTTNTKHYMQKFDINGNLLWINQYDVPGTNDWCHQLIKSGGGLVVLAAKNSSPSNIYVYKTDLNGAMLWGKEFQFSPPIITSIQVDRGSNQLLELGGNLYVTATGVTSNGTTDMLIIRMDLDGNTDMPCVMSVPLSIPVIPVASPVFYNVNPSVMNGTETVSSEFPDIIESPFTYRQECVVSDTIFEFVTAAICLGDTYEGYSMAGVYEDYFVTADGCDSLRTLTLSVNNPVTTSEQASICLGESYNGYTASGVYTQNFQNIYGCDSFHVLTLNVIPLFNNLDIEICDGQSYFGYTETGFYVDTIQGPSNECDTIQNLNLIVNPPAYTFINATICDGEQYEGYTNTGIYIDEFTTAQGCDSVRELDLTVYVDDVTEEDAVICLGESYNGYEETGVYTTLYQNINGCDSTVLLNLEVIPLEYDLFISICEGEAYDGYTLTGLYVDTIQGPPGECDTIRFLDLVVNALDFTDISISICTGDDYEGYTVSGIYTDVFVNQFGCDSTRVLDLTVTSEINTFIEQTICEGESYEGYTESGTYTDFFTSVFGCDSIRTLTLIIGQPEIQTTISICNGESYLGYTTPGNYTITIPGSQGACDTTLFLNLQVEPLFSFAIDQTICTGSNYLGYATSGIYVDTLDTSTGCDSIRILNLTVLDQLQSNAQITICHGGIYEGYSNEGIYVDTFSSIYGCDSIRTLELHLNFLISDVSVDLCSGGAYEGHTTTGIYLDTLYGAPGNCDTLRQLTINITPPLLTYINAGVCSGQTFLGYAQTGMYSDTFQTIDGCDSVRMLNLTVDDQIQTLEIITICSGQNYQGYDVEGSYVDTFTSVFGCDSIRFLELALEDPILQLDITICQGDQYLGYDQPGTYQDTFPGSLNACDTVRQLTLTVLPVIQSLISATICSGQNFEGYTMSGIYQDTFQTEGGCDSIRVLELVVTDIIVSSLDANICLGQSYEGYNLPGMYVDTFQSSFGCDSLRHLNLQILAPKKMIMAEICAGQHFEQYSISGNYIDTIPGVGGECDTVRELNLMVHPAQITPVDQVICNGESYLGYNQAGIYIDTLTTQEGCDSIRELHLQTLNPAFVTIQSSICEQVLTNYHQPGVYTDTLVSVQGCDSIVSYVIEDAGLYIPNVFSPNDDGINDVFTVFPYPATELNIEYFAIFDRFGDMVYETKEWPIQWLGKDHDGKRFQPAVFAYVLIYNCSDNRIVQLGDITLAK